MVKYDLYLTNKVFPMIQTSIKCDNCKHTLNAGPDYKPRFCDMCGAPIKDNLDKVEWRSGNASCAEYAEYMVDEHPDYIIRKVKYEATDWGQIGMQRDVEHIPVFIGADMNEIMALANYENLRYYEDDFEPATADELIDYAETCSARWRVM